MTNGGSALFYLKSIIIGSPIFMVVNWVCGLSKRPWRNLTRLFKKPLYIDYSIEISFWTRVPPSDWQRADWGCHKSWRLVSREPQGTRFLAVRSLIPWEYSHRRVSFQSRSPLRSLFQAAQGFSHEPSYKTFQFWPNLPQSNFSIRGLKEE